MTGPSTPRRRILFFAEAVTLAHVARPLALAGGLDPTRYEVVLATAPRYESLYRDAAVKVRPIESVTGGQFLDALAKGRPLYDTATLRRYVREDLDVIREVRPDLVVGDFRLSLSVSARLSGVPYLGITNAYWSPYARQRFPLPELPVVRWVGLSAAETLFRVARPLAFALHTGPLNRLRREHGLKSLGLDLRRVYTDADHVLYADVPELTPTYDLPGNHHYLGPILWSPDVSPPPWWEEVTTGRPVVYVTMGSSGSGALLSRVLEGLADLPILVIAATLGRPLDRPAPANARTTDFLPGREATALARFVVCNGGSPTTHQALAAGVPVLGVAGNMDQHLNMAGIMRLGAGAVIRSDRVTPTSVSSSAAQILAEPGYSEAAGSLAGIFARYDPHARFQSVVESV